MKDRIQRILDHKALTPSAFADEVDLSRAVVSHILHGRNKLSLDNIEKILIRFPDINPLWLISGKEPMILDYAQPSKNPTLFDQDDLFPYNGEAENEYAKENAFKNPSTTQKAIEIQPFTPKEFPAVKIKKIAVFYSDNTYEEFVPNPKG